jgi:hypothetical protein
LQSLFGKIDASVIIGGSNDGICLSQSQEKSQISYNDELKKSFWYDMIANPVDGTKQRRLTSFVPRTDEVPCDDVVLAIHISAERFHVLLAQATYRTGEDRYQLLYSSAAMKILIYFRPN